MSKQADLYRALAPALGLQYDTANNVLYGQKEGYDLIVYTEDPNHPYRSSIHTAAKNTHDASFTLTDGQLKELSKRAGHIDACIQNGYDLTAKIHSEKDKNTPLTELAASIAGSITSLLTFLRENGFHPCCSICGKDKPLSCHQVGWTYYHLCPDCERSIRETIDTMEPEEQHENVIGGIVGAFLGSLLGVVCIILLGQLGYVAALSGVVMAVGVLKGYNLLGGRISKKAVVICVLLMLIMTYAGDRGDWAIVLYREGGGADAGYNIFECYRLVPWAISEQVIETGTYTASLVQLYIFLLLGAVPTIYGDLKEKKERDRMVKIVPPYDIK